MEDIILQTNNLSKTYNKVALNGVNLTIRRGEMYGVVGRNGAGKTTLMRIVAGLAHKTGGDFSLFGIPDSDDKIDMARRRMSIMVEEAALYPQLTARQNMNARRVLLGIKNAPIDELIQEVGLDPYDRKKVKNYSLGMRQRLAIAVALVGEPEFLMLDEPTNGLDPAGILHIRSVLQHLNKDCGVTVMVASHILAELAKLCNRFGFLEQGQLLKEITAEELEHDCADSIRFQVSDVQRAVAYFNAINLPIIAINQNAVDVVRRDDCMAIAEGLTKCGVVVYGFQNLAVDLEAYFMNLIGGRYLYV